MGRLEKHAQNRFLRNLAHTVIARSPGFNECQSPRPDRAMARAIGTAGTVMTSHGGFSPPSRSVPAGVRQRERLPE